MAFTTYSELQTSVANYLSRDDMTSQIQDAIALAESRISRDVRTAKMLSSTTGTISSGSVSLPSDFLELRSIYLTANPGYQLEFVTPEHFYLTGQSDQSGTPRYFTIIGADMKFAPSQGDGITYLYYAKPAVLSGTNDSNVFLVNYPDAMLYGALAECETYLMNDERVATWSSLYDRAIENIRKSDMGAKYSGTTLTVAVA